MNTNYLFLNSRDELLRIDISKIVYFEADGNYTSIILTNKLRPTIGINLAQTEKLLNERLRERSRIFARIGKRYIINLNYVYQINVLKQRLVLSDYTNFAFQLEVSKEALKKLKEIFLSVKTA
ncbi:LytTR family DNA-binding domain-containing protein [Bacteroides bouchesdurhonensis]|uniref:LytTR family DNA-binding domain-containing protein n=1 Tax=Bacteroides bouchesdurhonensis TaxID=1841855 RepID=UPI00097FA187|nr:LytTR family DNA-binding domain-containing protein [Bacteroides bouchesdurhonensis]